MLAGVGPAPAVHVRGRGRRGLEAAVRRAPGRGGRARRTATGCSSSPAATWPTRGRRRAAGAGRDRRPPRSATVEAVAVSGRTGAGLADLRAALDRLVAAAARARRGRPGPAVGRPVLHHPRQRDRASPAPSAPARCAVGDELELGGRPAGPGARAAVAGPPRPGRAGVGPGRGQPARGDRRGGGTPGRRAAHPGACATATSVDVRSRRSPVTELPAELVLHIGSAAVPVRVRPLGAGHGPAAAGPAAAAARR